MLPQEGVGGWVPKPKKDRPASATMAPAMPNVAWTMTGPRTLGTRWRVMMRLASAPRARAAWTNSNSLSAKTCPLTRRA